MYRIRAMRLVMFLFSILFILSCKYENKQSQKQITHKDSIIINQYIKTRDSAIYHLNDSMRLYWLYGKEMPKTEGIKDNIYDISIMPSVLGSYLLDFCNVTIKKDTISGTLHERTLDRVLKGKKIRNKTKIDDRTIYFYMPKNISFYNPVISNILAKKLDKWAKRKQDGFDGGHIIIKQTNIQNQVFYYDLFWYIFEDAEAKYFYDTLCTELVGHTFD